MGLEFQQVPADYWQPRAIQEDHRVSAPPWLLSHTRSFRCFHDVAPVLIVHAMNAHAGRTAIQSVHREQASSSTLAHTTPHANNHISLLNIRTPMVRPDSQNLTFIVVKSAPFLRVHRCSSFTNIVSLYSTILSAVVFPFLLFVMNIYIPTLNLTTPTCIDIIQVARSVVHILYSFYNMP